MLTALKVCEWESNGPAFRRGERVIWVVAGPAHWSRAGQALRLQRCEAWSVLASSKGKGNEKWALTPNIGGRWMMYLLSSGKVRYQALQQLLSISETCCLVYNGVTEILAAWRGSLPVFHCGPKVVERKEILPFIQDSCFASTLFFALVLYCSCSRKHTAQRGWGKGTNLVFLLMVLLHIAKSDVWYQHQRHCSQIWCHQWCGGDLCLFWWSEQLQWYGASFWGASCGLLHWGSSVSQKLLGLGSLMAGVSSHIVPADSDSTWSITLAPAVTAACKACSFHIGKGLS